MGDLMVCVRIFFPRTSGDRIFCPDIQSYCMAGISLQDFSCAQNQTSRCFFLKSPIPTLKSHIIIAKRIRDRSLFIPLRGGGGGNKS